VRMKCSRVSVWTTGRTDKFLTTAGTRTILHSLPKPPSTHYVYCSRIIPTKSQSFCMINSSASLTGLAVLLPQSCEGSCYVVHISNWRNTQTYAHMTSRTLPTCDTSFRLRSHCVRIWPTFYTGVHCRHRQKKQMRLNKCKRSQWRPADQTYTDVCRRLTVETKSFCFFRPCMPVCRVVSC
jgi:hypothetical protein